MDSNEVGGRTVSKVFWRLLPFLFILYVIAFLDRVNVGFAALSMNSDLGFTAAVYGFGAGIFFIGYFFFEIPCTLLMYKYGARFWVARILISWGIVSALQAWVTTPTEFYIVRFFLGVAEASFCPGVLYYLSTWFRAQDQAKASALFLAALPVSSVIGAPISTYILGFNWLGWAGWHWLFILEAVPAVLFGFITYLYLPNKVEDAKWLSTEEKSWLSGALEAEKVAKQAVKHVSMLQSFTNRNVVLLTLAYLPFCTGFYGVTMFLPILVKNLSSALSNQMVGLLVAIPYIVAVIAMYLVSRSSDRLNERKVHTIVCLLVGAFGLFGSEFLASGVWSSLFFFTLGVGGTYAMFGPFWSIPSSFLTGGATAAGISVIMAFGNLGGFFGPALMGYLKDYTGSFSAGVLFLVGCLLVSGALVMVCSVSGKAVSVEANKQAPEPVRVQS